MLSSLIAGCCDMCQRSTSLKKTPTELHPVPVPDKAFKQWGMDLVGKCKTTAKGNCYLMVMIEYLSKWVEVRAIPKKTAEEIAAAIMDVICRFGVMTTIISDQGREFCNAVNDDLCKRLKIDHRVTTAYHPQANGLTERFNRTLCNTLTKYINNTQTDWDEHISPILFAYRTAIHSSTKATPFSIVYGRKPTLPVEYMYPTGAPQDSDVEWSHTGESDGTTDRLEQHVEAMQSALHVESLAKANIVKAQARQKRQYDSRHLRSKPTFKVGDEVLLKVSRQEARCGGKLEHKWKGPYTITAESHKGVCVLQGLKQKVNVARLKLYVKPTSPETLSETFPSRCTPPADGISDTECEVVQDVPSESPETLSNSFPSRCTLPASGISDTECEVVQDVPSESMLFEPVSREWQNGRAAVFGVSLPQDCIAPNKRSRLECRQVSRKAPPASTVSITGDGNCFFRAVSLLAFGSENHHTYLRAELCAYITYNEAIVQKFTGDEKYLQKSRMAQLKEWATANEIVFMASLMATDISVFCASAGGKCMWLTYAPLAGLAPLPGLLMSPKSLYLSNVTGVHFDAVLDV